MQILIHFHWISEHRNTVLFNLFFSVLFKEANRKQNGSKSDVKRDKSEVADYETAREQKIGIRSRTSAPIRRDRCTESTESNREGSEPSQKQR